ncbi:hypothetical protein V1279_001930 [Bradyrhizobium sp. AZCC 1610]|uniref:hypothetical protein n=1 Tax=Bradyrhizobium sp. AZCC 1610 TaxID=3117020 RepID=UPI002FEEDE5C
MEEENTKLKKLLAERMLDAVNAGSNFPRCGEAEIPQAQGTRRSASWLVIVGSMFGWSTAAARRQLWQRRANCCA